jgi:hypothetical protein
MMWRQRRQTLKQGDCDDAVARHHLPGQLKLTTGITGITGITGVNLHLHYIQSSNK